VRPQRRKVHRGKKGPCGSAGETPCSIATSGARFGPATNRKGSSQDRGQNSCTEIVAAESGPSIEDLDCHRRKESTAFEEGQKIKAVRSSF